MNLRVQKLFNAFYIQSASFEQFLSIIKRQEQKLRLLINCVQVFKQEPIFPFDFPVFFLFYLDRIWRCKPGVIRIFLLLFDDQLAFYVEDRLEYSFVLLMKFSLNVLWGHDDNVLLPLHFRF